MKKWLLASGLILICIGLVLMSTSNLTQEKTSLQQVASTNDEWRISGAFDVDDRMVVIFREAYNWSMGFFEPDGTALLYVYIHILDPQNNETRFKVTLTPSNPGYPGLFILDISVKINGSLDTSSVRDAKTGLITGIGGIVQYNGIYNVSVDVYPPRQNPPETLQLYEEKTESQYPYTFLFPSGAAIGLVGTAISLFGLKSGKQRVSSKSRKIRISPPKKDAPARFSLCATESLCAQ